jgi:hypothetical protein
MRPQGNLLESISHFQNSLIQRCTNVYDEAGRVREIKYRNSDGTETSAEVKYGQYGQPYNEAWGFEQTFRVIRRVRTCRC